MSVIPSTVDRVRRHTAATVKRATHCKPRAARVKWNPGISEHGKVVGMTKHGKGFSAPRKPSKRSKKQHAGRTLKSND